MAPACRIKPPCIRSDIKTRICIFAALGVGIISACAQEKVPPATEIITIKDSRSPDGRKDITITNVADQIEGDSYDADVRELKTGKPLFRFSWIDGPRMQTHPSETALEVSWRADSNAFATLEEVAYGESDCEVYAKLGDGKLHGISLPLFKLLVDKKYRLNSKGKGYARVVKWLPHNRFIVEASDQRWDNDYWITCRFSSHAVSTPQAAVDDIQPASKQ